MNQDCYTHTFDKQKDKWKACVLNHRPLHVLIYEGRTSQTTPPHAKAMTTATARRQRRGSKPPQEVAQTHRADETAFEAGTGGIPRPLPAWSQAAPPSIQMQEAKPAPAPCPAAPAAYNLHPCGLSSEEVPRLQITCEVKKVHRNSWNLQIHLVVTVQPYPTNPIHQMRFAVADVWEKGPKDVH
ncbi:uncharacterized protein LOC112576474 isoform X2 [Pomacea canaliculata]|uniref:uncharacterized protein LOC112576474 isoform X2 n=1 Tax=Pomacea canaliculata TaxID=400727 RepID=UPI000D73F680|nr:uncharacterized protein LOC112576474 isoform X2 [Pomacea canaliculata]